MLPTPSTSHVNYDHIYEPSEDSYLLLDTLSLTSETDFLKARFPSHEPPPLVLEVGPGSGVVLAFVTAQASYIFGRSDVATFGLDVNCFACAATGETAKTAISDGRAAGARSGVFLDALCGDLTAAVKPGAVDVLIFNPPYVPTAALPSIASDDDDGAFDRDIRLSSLSTDGGIDGMETTSRLLLELPRVLSTRGVAYILLCAQNRPDEIMSSIRQWPTHYGTSWHVEKIGSSGKQAGWEKLCIIRIERVLPET